MHLQSQRQGGMHLRQRSRQISRRCPTQGAIHYYHLSTKVGLLRLKAAVLHTRRAAADLSLAAAVQASLLGMQPHSQEIEMASFKHYRRLHQCSLERESMKLLDTLPAHRECMHHPLARWMFSRRRRRNLHWALQWAMACCDISLTWTSLSSQRLD